MSALQIYLLGEFRVIRDGEPIPEDVWVTQKAKTLLKILLTHRGHALVKDRVIEWLWPEANPKAADGRLRVGNSSPVGAY